MAQEISATIIYFEFKTIWLVFLRGYMRTDEGQTNRADDDYKWCIFKKLRIHLNNFLFKNQVQNLLKVILCHISG